MQIDALRAVPPAAGSAIPRDPAAAVGAFEALVVERLLEPATRPLFGPTPFGGGTGSRMARELFAAELARQVAAAGGLGLAAALAPALAPEPGGGS